MASHHWLEVYVTRLHLRLNTLGKVSPPFQNLPARGKMVTLYCAIVGVTGSAFLVDIDDKKSVGHLNDAIKVKKPDTVKGEADKLQLFPAKKADGAWLSSRLHETQLIKTFPSI
nr:Crinkler effector protein 1 [Phytophthora ramorum]